VSRQTKANADAILSTCMIRDRFRLAKVLRGGVPKSGGLKKKLDRSIATAAARFESVPKPSYPEALPVSGRVDDIRRALEKNQVIIVAGETGSGKTTQLPKICLDAGRGVYGKIGHTQPRRVAARTVAHRIAEELGVKLGESVGYQVRFTDQSSDASHIKVMTDGILLAETQNDRFLEEYDTIIIDEAHERSLNIDFLLGYLKRILPKRPDLKVIITSATIDVERFSKHFGNAPVIEVSGRTYPVEVLYRPPELHGKSEDSDELMYLGVLEAMQEIRQLEKGYQTPGDVLVFLSGEREIRELAHRIRKADLKGFEVLPLYSRLSVAEQNRVFQSHSGRRIVLATNVAETSLTVPGIRYVIDPGFARISRYSVRSKVQQLPIEPISQASANQRKGRCGRVSEGVCFRLYSEADFVSRPEFTAPEILRTNLAAVILQMLSLKLGQVEKFPFIERPEQRQINDGYQLLHELTAVDDKREMTKAGRQIARLPIDLRLGRMLLEASKKGSLAEVITIVSALALQDPRERPHEHQQAADEKHREFWDEKSDFIALLNLWNHLEEQRQALTNNQFRKYCRTRFVSYVRYLEWRENHRQLTLMCRELKFRFNNNVSDYDAIHIALLSGLLGNIGEKHDDNEYLGARNRRHYIFPGSSQFKRKPRWIVSAELTETTRLFGRMVAQIESEWIEPLAQHLVKRTYHEPHFDAKRGQVLAYEEVMLYGLVVVKRRKVDYSLIDPAQCRHLLIQTGLVEQQLESKAAFYRHNLQLVKDIEALESKSRKRDLLVDSYTIYRFYDGILPIDITSARDLDRWRKEVEVKQPKRLFLSEDKLLKQAPELSEQLYPNELKVADTALPLDYHFDPQHEDDGVSLKVPVAILRQVDEKQLDWVIPGLLEEKCLALIKSLPKSVRKNFIPAPDYAARAAENLEYDGRSLPESLAERLFRLTGVRVNAADFKTDTIDQHLRMNIKVMDEKGGTLGTGRDLHELQSKFAAKAESQFQAKGQHGLEQTGLTDWSFADLPEQVALKQGQIQIKGFPALSDDLDSVSIKILDNQRLASVSQRNGLLRLLRLTLKDQEKYLSKNIPGFVKFSLYYATRGNKQALLELLVSSIFRYTFIEAKGDVRTAAEFKARQQDKGKLMEVAAVVGKVMGEALQRANDIEAKLKSGFAERHPQIATDVREQLDRLLGQEYLQYTPLEWLREYPRYFRAIEYRLDKIQGNVAKDAEAVAVLRRYWQQFDAIDAKQKFDVTSELTKFRWMLEELRVSLFAQPLGTRLPVSTKRLDKQWQKAMNDD
jgi:ATP-dependent helicase HrpA